MNWTHSGIEIAVNKGGYFVLEIEGDLRQLATLAEAKTQAEQHTRAVATSSYKNLRLPVILVDGARTTFTGLNRTSSDLKLAGNVASQGLHRVQAWADAPWVEELLTRQREITKELSQVRARLAPAEVKRPTGRGRGYAGRIAAEDYEEMMDEVVAQHGKMLEGEPEPEDIG